MTERNRYDDALFITAGACNPSAIALTLRNACVEAMREGKDTKGVCEDAAVRLIAHQLAYLLKIQELDDDLNMYGELTTTCRLHAKDHPAQYDTALEEGTRYERAFGDGNDVGG